MYQIRGFCRAFFLLKHYMGANIPKKGLGQDPKDILLNRAKSKFLSYNLSNFLIASNPDSPLIKGYSNSLYCNAVYEQDGYKLKTHWCNSRWCAACNRLRTAKVINGYLSQIREYGKFDKWYFVTLTKKTVSENDLPGSIVLMNKVWKNILDSKINRTLKIKGIRKSECTIRPDGMFHYHFHVIVLGEKNASWLIDAWLERLDGHCVKGAQDMRILDDNGYKEIFKYFTKLTISDKSGKKSLYSGKDMDTVFRAMYGRRVYQTFGGLRKVVEDIDAVSVSEFTHLDNEKNIYTWVEEDWYNLDGVELTGYRAPDVLKDIFVSTKILSETE